MKWDARAEYVDNILDLCPGKLTVIIGTLFKEQKRKPDVFADITGVIKNPHQLVDLSFGVHGVSGDMDMAGCFVSDDDQIILEDSSGRINIRASENFKPEELVTGLIIALLGVSDNLSLIHI